MLRRLWNWLVGSRNEPIRSELLEAVEVDRIQRLQLLPGDTVVLTTPGQLPVKAIEDLAARFQTTMAERGVSNVGLMVLQGGFELKAVLGAGAQAECHTN